MSLAKTYELRDAHVNKEIHRLFLAGMMQKKLYLVLAFSLAPALFLMYVFIPLQVAFTIQAVIAKDFDAVNQYVVIILIAAIVQVILHSIGAWAHNRNGVYACGYVQRMVFANYLDKDYDFYSDQYVGSLGMHAAQLRDACSMYSEIFVTQVSKQGTIIIGGVVVIAHV